jgi:hypothetical protein
LVRRAGRHGATPAGAAATSSARTVHFDEAPPTVMMAPDVATGETAVAVTAAAMGAAAAAESDPTPHFERLFRL